jgi:HK97 gp10 family phage protein
MAVLFIPDPTLVAQIYVDPEIGVTMAAIGEEALAFAQDHAPVETGALKRSLRRDSIPGNGQRISVNVDYWHFPEYGTSRMASQSYLRSALSAVGLNLT